VLKADFLLAKQLAQRNLWKQKGVVLACPSSQLGMSHFRHDSTYCVGSKPVYARSGQDLHTRPV
jgi:hypothetical protein